VVVVTAGALLEDRFDLPERRVQRSHWTDGVLHVIRPWSCHRVRNPGPDPATSIHVYAPPLASMTYYEVGPGGTLRPTQTMAVAAPSRRPAGASAHPWRSPLP